MSTSVELDVVAELLPGYWIEDATGAWMTLPWPERLEDLPPSLAPDILRWCWGQPVPKIAGVEGPRLRHHLDQVPWEFTRDQKRFLHLWYAVRPDGRWLYRSGVKRGAKGTGKDPFMAAIAHIEANGPVVLEDWDAGRPIGRAQGLALVQLGANSEAQAKDVLRVVNGMVTTQLRLELGVDDGITKTQFGGGSLIELLTASEKSTEGDPATAVLLNETHHMTESSGGKKVAAVGRRNAAKSPGGRCRALEFTNAHMPGEESEAEGSFDAWQLQVAGATRRSDILYDSREAPPHLQLHIEDELEEAIAAAYADSPWSDQERLRDDAQDPRTPAADSVRYYCNALPTNETAWVEPRRFDALAEPDTVVADGDGLAVFVDCSKSRDATVICASRISDGHVVAVRGWQRPHGDRGKGWLAPKVEVDTELRLLFDRYDVQWCGVDPSPARDDETEAQYWTDTIDGWHRDFRTRLLLWATPGINGSSVRFDMRLSTPGGRERNRLFTEAAERTALEIDEEGTLSWDGDAMLRSHAHNARRRPNPWGVSLGKRTRDSSQLVDMAVAMVGARMGRRIVLNSGKNREKPRSGIVRGIR